MDGCRVGRKGRLEQRWMDVEWGEERKTGAEVDGCRVGGKEDWSRGGWM